MGLFGGHKNLVNAESTVMREIDAAIKRYNLSPNQELDLYMRVDAALQDRCVAAMGATDPETAAILANRAETRVLSIRPESERPD